MEQSPQISHAELAKVLRRAGYQTDQINEIVAHLPDPVDADRDSQLLARYGLTRDRLMDRMSGSP